LHEFVFMSRGERVPPKIIFNQQAISDSPFGTGFDDAGKGSKNVIFEDDGITCFPNTP